MLYQTHKGRKRRMLIICALFALLSLLLAMLYLYFTGQNKKLKEEYDQIIDTIQLESKMQQKMVYVSNRSIKAGERITSLDTTYDMVYSSMDASLFAEIGDSYKVALVDIPEGVQLLESMVTEEEIDDHVREEEFGVFYLSDNLVENDMVDVRIFFPNGENYIVLSKKCLKDVSLDMATCYLWLDEQETLLISSAIVDAYMISGAYLYTTRYVENTLQEPSVVTYTPSDEIITMIEDSPNIVDQARLVLSRKVRESLETRSDAYIDENKEEIPDSLADFVYGGAGMNETEAAEGTQDTLEEEKEDEIIYVD